MGKGWKEGDLRAGDLAESPYGNNRGKGVDRVEWIYASDSVPDRTIQLECVGW
jgi:hypothetical protein